MKDETIKVFSGEYRWLSNFAPVKIQIGKRIFRSVEHAYQSEKSNEKEWKIGLARLKKTVVFNVTFT